MHNIPIAEKRSNNWNTLIFKMKKFISQQDLPQLSNK